jgi:5-methylthioribose kinase
MSCRSRETSWIGSRNRSEPARRVDRREDSLGGMNIEIEEELRDYLAAVRGIRPSDIVEVHVLAGGVSSRTVRVALSGGTAWVLKQALPRLRVRMEWFSDPCRAHREALGMRHLERLLPTGAVPRFLFEDESCHLVAMEAVREPHANWKGMLLAGDVQPAHAAQFGSLLATLHRQAWHERDSLAEEFSDRTYFETLRLEPYYRVSAEKCPEAARFLQGLIDRTLARRWTLVHGDYSPKNVLIHNGQLVLLDHEVIHWGDPAFDLGFALTHLLSKAFHLVEHRRAFQEAAELLWDRYREELRGIPWREELDEQAVHHTLGCLLARTVGRSPLEYLSESERGRQQWAAVRLMAAPPRRLEGLPCRFLEELERECP